MQIFHIQVCIICLYIYTYHYVHVYLCVYIYIYRDYIKLLSNCCYVSPCHSSSPQPPPHRHHNKAIYPKTRHIEHCLYHRLYIYINSRNYNRTNIDVVYGIGSVLCGVLECYIYIYSLVACYLQTPLCVYIYIRCIHNICSLYQTILGLLYKGYMLLQYIYICVYIYIGPIQGFRVCGFPTSQEGLRMVAPERFRRFVQMPCNDLM